MDFVRRHRIALMCSAVATAYYVFLCVSRVDFIPQRSGGFDTSLLYIALQGSDSGDWLRPEDIAGSRPQMDAEFWSSFYVNKARSQLRGYTIILAAVIGLSFVVEFFVEAAGAGSRSIRNGYRQARVEREQVEASLGAGDPSDDVYESAVSGAPGPVTDRELRALSSKPLADLTDEEYDDLIDAALAAREDSSAS